MKAITTEQFTTMVGQGSGVVLVDFWAEWCAPCRILKPQLDELSLQYGNRVSFYAVDVDSEGDLSMQFGIRSIPTVMIFVDGTMKDKIIGVHPKGIYSEKLDSYIQELESSKIVEVGSVSAVA